MIYLGKVFFWRFSGGVKQVKAKKQQKKKKNTNANSNVNNKSNLKNNHEVIGIVFISIGILMFLGFYFTSSIGIFGQILRKLFFGLIGIPAYIIPPFVIGYGIVLIINKTSKTIYKRLFYAIILTLLMSSFTHTIMYKSEDYENLSVTSSIAEFFTNGTENSGGGAIGGILSAPLIALLKPLGTIIILVTLSLIDIILLTNMSIANFVRNIRKRIKQKAEEQSEKKMGTVQEDSAVGMEPDIIGDDDDLSLEFKYRPKVIDFKIEKTSRELKEVTNSTPDKSTKSGRDHLADLVIGDARKKVKKQPETLVVTQADVQDTKPEAEEKKAEKPESFVVPDININAEQKNLGYVFPPLDILNENTELGKNVKNYKNTAIESARKLESTLASFGVEAKVINISRGPAVTRFELQPSPGVKVSKIVNLADDISLNLAASGVRIEAPIPGKAAIGIEVPNKEMTPVYIKEVLEAEEFTKHRSSLAFALGKDISGDNIVADIGKMPHLLIAGATGSGKSVCINSLIISLLYKASPEDVKLLMIDPKVVELGIYNGIPHLLIPVVTDPRKSAGALNWAVQEMVNRYKLFAEKGVRDIKGYNTFIKNNTDEKPLPQVVIIIDELADLMMVAPNDVEDAICRLAQMARAAGMHLVIATQRPSVDVITGVIKANIPSRIAFAVSSQVDSRTILDMAGAEKLLGQGDMLYFPVGEPKPIRVKGSFISDKEVESVVENIKMQGRAEYDDNIIEKIDSENDSPIEKDPGDNDELLPQAIEMVVEAGMASVSFVQRKFKVGYARAARIIDQMEERGIVGAFEGSKPRQVLISKLQLQEMLLTKDKNSGTK